MLECLIRSNVAATGRGDEESATEPIAGTASLLPFDTFAPEGKPA